MKNINRKYIAKFAFASVCIVALMLSTCSCGMYSFVMQSEGGYDFGANALVDNGPSTVINNNNSHYDREEVTIEKAAPIIKEEGERLNSAGQPYNTVSEVYLAVADSVVEITTEIVENGGWMGQYVTRGAGSGVIIDDKGFIVTNDHVIDGAEKIIVRLTDGSEYSATLIGTEPSADIAVIKIEPGDKELVTASLGCSADLVVGEDVVALGNPLGSLGGTLTTGIISATERNMTVNGEEMVLLQTNAAINPGNSGGGLFNMAGQLIGVVNAKASGEDVEGLGFAIPIDFAHKVIEDLINYGYMRGVVDHGLIMLDVTAQNLPTAYRKYGITNVGVVILDSEFTSDLKYGDTIVSINGESITSSDDVELIIKSFGIGDTITVSVTRGGSRVDVELTLREKVPDSVKFN